ncbi:FimB/Mfa2 family fimbrial subunit [uncultured Porphyromonas sp.]|uniref:FimB/Mfa2 family fimbrial subunit n=1 Tax=uncultured Porphyromonas sp. TaxID=159274 RepID=UPI0026036306|nr:FimB/Mfa2 family fimbrial subunit [uncultured Porphyromonas sp.]
MKRHTIYSILLLPLLILSLVSCDKYIYDRGECPTILVFTPYMQTPCMSDSAYIGKAAELHLVICDPTSGEIIAYKHLESVDLTATSAIEVPVPNKHGDTYRYSLWVGATPQHYMVSDLVSAARPKLADSRLALRLNEQDRHMGLLPEPLYFATGTIDCPVPLEGSSIRVPVAPNLTRYSNNFDIHITKLPSRVLYPLQIQIEDNNAAYDFMGQLTNPTKHVIYQADLPNEGTTRSTRLSTLRLDDPKTRPLLSIVRPDTGAKIFTYNLKELLAKKLEYRPECQFEYDIEIRLQELPDNTHYAVEIIIDGWRVHSYEIEL